ncbi:MAG: hypothetical protein COA57_16305 [Flavobacteriales bacterium]|nr:MAG: hypothetical protein COA57_16305 [Flavobacteriales bacterium]
MDISAQPKGIYFVKVANEKTTVTEKIIHQ